MLKSSLNDYKVISIYLYIPVKRTINVAREAAPKNDKQVKSKNCAPFTDFSSEIKEIQK